MNYLVFLEKDCNGKKDRCTVFGSNDDRLFPVKYTVKLSLCPKSVNVNIILSTTLGLFRGNLQHWLGDFARLLKVQFTSNEGMSNDAPIHECESEIDHLTLSG